MADVIQMKAKRGFAVMSPELRKKIASKGGKAAHLLGVAHEWTPEEARIVGRKGGSVSRGGRGKLPETVKVSEMRGRTRTGNRG